jgi:hypothetical protein
MANQWLRLWHDMPTDPKFGTVARVSGEHITLVLSVYLHLMTDASRNVTRGHVTVTAEDLATALHVTDEQIERVLTAMEGRLIESSYLSGWEKRQPKREDSGDEETGAKSAAQRKKEQREREKAAREANAIHGTDTQSHEASRNVTLDKEEDKDKEIHTASAGGFDSFYSTYPKKVGKPAAVKAWKTAKVKPAELVTILADIATRSQSTDWQKDGGQFIPNPATYLNQRRWEDGHAVAATASSAFAGGI